MKPEEKQELKDLLSLNDEQLTEQQEERLSELLSLKQRARQRQAQERKEEYKRLVDEAVSDMFPKLEKVQQQLKVSKKEVQDTFSTIIALKRDLFKVDASQASHTFTDSLGMYRISIGSYQRDDWDDTVNEGIAIVKDRMESYGKDENSKALVEVVMKLLSKDSKGTLKAQKVLELQQLAERTQDEELIRGVNVIRDSYSPVQTKQFIRAEWKDELGNWVNVPLGMTEA